MSGSSPPRPTALIELDPALRGSLERIYERLDEELSSLRATCAACGSCCRFDEFRHQLWLTGLELAYLIGAHGPPGPAADGVCPYLAEGRCTAREGRALGCRVFHCALPAATMEELSQRYCEMVDRLVVERGLERSYFELLDGLGALASSRG